MSEVSELIDEEEVVLLADEEDEDAPLLTDADADAAGAPTPRLRATHATAHLVNTIVGAGVMALPHAFAALGVAAGGAALAAAAGVTLFSLAALVRAARRTRRWTYAELAALFGPPGAAAYRAAVVANNGGTMLIYLIVIADILVGSAANGHAGLVTDLVPPALRGAWFVSRPAVMAAFCALALAPLLALRSLRRLAPASSAAVAVSGAFVAAVLGLAGWALAAGRAAPDWRWGPPPAAPGAGAGARVLAAAGVLPVLAVCFTCQYQVLPLAAGLERASPRRAAMVARRAVAACGATFAGVAAGGYVLFGGATEGNLLLNLTPAALAGRLALAPRLAAGLCLGVRAGYCLCLASTFAMLNWALRDALAGALAPRGCLGAAAAAAAAAGGGAARLPAPAFLALSWGTLAALLGASLAYPNVWGAMQLVGSTAAVALSYTLPGMLVLKLEGPRSHARAAGGAALVLAGLSVCAVGVGGALGLLPGA